MTSEASASRSSTAIVSCSPSMPVTGCRRHGEGAAEHPERGECQTTIETGWSLAHPMVTKDGSMSRVRPSSTSTANRWPSRSDDHALGRRVGPTSGEFDASGMPSRRRHSSLTVASGVGGSSGRATCADRSRNSVWRSYPPGLSASGGPADGRSSPTNTHLAGATGPENGWWRGS